MERSLWMPLNRPFTDNRVMVRGEGIFLYDAAGQKYADANSGLWNVPMGYSDPDIKEAVKEQLDRLCFINPYEYISDASGKLAEEIAGLFSPDVNKCIFTCTGSESLELVIKLIRRYQVLKGRPERYVIAVIDHSYHGNFYGTMSMSRYDREYAAGYGPLLHGFKRISLPFDRDRQWDEIKDESIKTLEKELDRLGRELAGIVAEPVLGSAGVIPMDRKWLEYLLEYCRDRDIITAFDEVATGFGRTGRMFYQDNLSVRPDITAMSKGINNGVLPLGAVAVSDRITEVFEASGEALFHLSTQNCNPVCCAGASAMIKKLNCMDGILQEQVSKTGKLFENSLKEKLGGSVSFHSIRREGLMLALELKGPEDPFRQPGTSLYPGEKLFRLKKNIEARGVILEWSFVKDTVSCLVLFPMFITGRTDVEFITGIIAEEIYKMEKKCKRVY